MKTEVHAQAESAEATELGGVYAAEHVVLRMLRAMGWGPVLLNLGYFRWRGPLLFLNFVPDPLVLARAQHRLVRRTGSLLAPRPGEQVLDVACGRGQTSYHLASTFPGTEVTGVDLLGANIDVARALFANTRNLRFRVGNAMCLDFPGGSFDKVQCLEAAFHFPDRARFLTEAARVLKPGGRLVVVDFAWREADGARHAGDVRTKLVQKIWGWSDFSSVAGYQDAAVQAGFAVEALHDWTSRVTAPLQRLSDWLVSMAMSRSGRRLLNATNPATRGISRGDWAEIAKATAAHGFVQSQSRYLAMVLRRGGA